MKIKDLHSGSVFDYGNCHDSLRISEDGRSLSYYNLQNGDGSRFGDYRFVMEDGEVPVKSESPDALYGECFFNIGGWPSRKRIMSEEIKEFGKWLVDCKVAPEGVMKELVRDFIAIEEVVKG